MKIPHTLRSYFFVAVVVYVGSSLFVDQTLGSPRLGPATQRYLVYAFDVVLALTLIVAPALLAAWLCSGRIFVAPSVAAGAAFAGHGTLLLLGLAGLPLVLHSDVSRWAYVRDFLAEGLTVSGAVLVLGAAATALSAGGALLLRRRRAPKPSPRSGEA